MFFTLADDWDFICWVLWGFRGGTFIFFYFHQEEGWGEGVHHLEMIDLILGLVLVTILRFWMARFLICV